MNTKSKVTDKTLKEIEGITGAKLTLGKLIWSIRQADNVPQRGFAEVLGITKQQLCDIEHDRKSVSPKLAASYAKILGYSEEQFVRLALQDLIDRSGLNLQVEISPRNRKKGDLPHFRTI